VHGAGRSGVEMGDGAGDEVAPVAALGHWEFVREGLSIGNEKHIPYWS